VQTLEIVKVVYFIPRKAASQVTLSVQAIFSDTKILQPSVLQQLTQGSMNLLRRAAETTSITSSETTEKKLRFSHKLEDWDQNK